MRFSSLTPVTMATRSFQLIRWTLLSGCQLRRRRGWQSTGTTHRRQSILSCELLAILLICATRVASVAAATADSSSVAGGNLLTHIAATRSLKDSLFRHGEDSPLRPGDIPTFAGLHYYPADLQWRVAGELHRYGRTLRIPLPDTGGSTIAVERFGRFVFQFDGKPFWLEVYRSLQGGSLTVYFTDETNGETTYGAGRYAVVSDLGNSSYVLDFNGAYSPYCAYNEDYVCPLPPTHNHLPFKVSAGELHTGPDVAH